MRDTQIVSKVPPVTALFWIMKIIATTLGETGGDALSMSMGLGYLLSTGIFGLCFVVALTAQVRTRQCQPLIYWLTIVATTTVGTTLADFADRSLGIGYAGGATLLLLCLLASFWIWHRTLGTVALDSVSRPQAEVFYWVTILFSQTLGTALGDWTADTAGLGYLGAAAVFAVVVMLLVVLTYVTAVSRTALFWIGFVLTRPLGAVVGDYLDKPISEGGLALSRYSASAVLIAALLMGLLLTNARRRPAAAQ